MKNSVVCLILTGMFTLIIGSVISDHSQAEEMSCAEIRAGIAEVRKEYKRAKHKEKKAFDNWDKYYKELHSYEYGGTDRPLAYSAKACREGEGIDERFCKGALDRYDELSGKEAAAKKELDTIKENADQMGGNLAGLRKKADMKGCK